MALTTPDLFAWGTRTERERRVRIRLCVAAYAYEVAQSPVMSDAVYDALARTSDPSVTTGRHDEWWRREFAAHTGQWIHTHPDLSGVERLFRRLR